MSTCFKFEWHREDYHGPNTWMTDMWAIGPLYIDLFFKQMKAGHWQNILQLLETIFPLKGKLFFTNKWGWNYRKNTRTGIAPNILHSQYYNPYG